MMNKFFAIKNWLFNFAYATARTVVAAPRTCRDLLGRVKSAPAFALRCAHAVWGWAKRDMNWLFAAAVLVPAAVIGTMAGASWIRYCRTYDLTILLQYGPQLLSGSEPIVVTNVSHQSDGSLCFYAVEYSRHDCLKLSSYTLIERKGE